MSHALCSEIGAWVYPKKISPHKEYRLKGLYKIFDALSGLDKD